MQRCLCAATYGISTCQLQVSVHYDLDRQQPGSHESRKSNSLIFRGNLNLKKVLLFLDLLVNFFVVLSKQPRAQLFPRFQELAFVAQPAQQPACRVVVVLALLVRVVGL